MKGVFVTFEGCEGSGKSTQLKLLKEHFERECVDFVFAREPGGTEISEKIRQIILDKNNEKLGSKCESLLYAASRVQLLDEVVMPALKEGKVVLLDRYIDSSFAYQAFARGLGFDFVESVNRFAVENCMPNLTIFLDIDPKAAFERKGGADKNDRVELAGLDFHEKVYLGYLELVKKYPERIKRIDGTKSKEEIHREIVRLLQNFGIFGQN